MKYRSKEPGNRWIRGKLEPIIKPDGIPLHSSFRAVSEQFQSNFRAVSEQFQSSFRAVSEQFRLISKGTSVHNFRIDLTLLEDIVLRFRRQSSGVFDVGDGTRIAFPMCDGNPELCPSLLSSSFPLCPLLQHYRPPNCIHRRSLARPNKKPSSGCR